MRSRRWFAVVPTLLALLSACAADNQSYQWVLDQQGLNPPASYPAVLADSFALSITDITGSAAFLLEIPGQTVDLYTVVLDGTNPAAGSMVQIRQMSGDRTGRVIFRGVPVTLGSNSANLQGAYSINTASNDITISFNYDGQPYSFRGNLTSVIQINRTLYLNSEFLNGQLPNVAPRANAGPDQTVIGNASVADVVLDGSASSDPDDGIDVYEWTSAGMEAATGVSPTVHLAVGRHTINLRVRDHAGLLDNDQVTIEVLNPNLPPTANAGPDQTVIGSATGVDVVLNGSASSDPDDGIDKYIWSEGGSPISSGVSPTVHLAVGTHTINLLVYDRAGAYGTDQVTITVLSPAGATEALGGSVQDLVASGAITSATASQLTSSLTAAMTSLANGNTTAGGNQLGAFINKVQAGMKTGKISAADGNALIAYANKVKQSL